MKSFKGKTLRWEWREGCIELTLDHEPANEIGTAMLEELEIFAGGFGTLAPETSACIISSARKSVFSAGGDLRELYQHAMSIPEGERLKGIRRFLERIHAVMNAIDTAPLVTIAGTENHAGTAGWAKPAKRACPPEPRTRRRVRAQGTKSHIFFGSRSMKQIKAACALHRRDARACISFRACRYEGESLVHSFPGRIEASTCRAVSFRRCFSSGSSLNSMEVNFFA